MDTIILGLEGFTNGAKLGLRSLSFSRPKMSTRRSSNSRSDLDWTDENMGLGGFLYVDKVVIR